jgi:hypothetical protein
MASLSNGLKDKSSVFGGQLTCHAGSIWLQIEHGAGLKKDSSRMTSGRFGKSGYQKT